MEEKPRRARTGLIIAIAVVIILAGVCFVLPNLINN